MHMKRLLIASGDTHTIAWVHAALAGLDLKSEEVAVAELRRHLMAGEPDLVVVDTAHDSERLFQTIEDAAAGGIEVSMLAVVDASALASLRLPVRLPSDFVVRGASADEFAARLRNLLWPGEDLSREELLRIDNLTLNLATYQAHIDGKPVDFTYLEYALFAFLVTHPGRTHTREALLRRVWGTEYYGGSRTVDVHIRRIRSKIGAELSHHLETVRNVGYLWNA